MPTHKVEEFSFGGCDSRSNPANYPMDRALRCLNFTPQSSGTLRLRAGYSVPMDATNDTVGATTLHSIIYYEQFAASYLGPQFCLYGKNTEIEVFNLTTGVSTLIGNMVTTNPWGHFRSNNYIFVSDGASGFANLGLNADIVSWDGTTLRAAGLPSPLTVPVPLAGVNEYCGTGTDLGGTNTWSTVSNITGPPTSVFASAIATFSPSLNTNELAGTNFGLSVLGSAQIFGVSIGINVGAFTTGAPAQEFFYLQLTYRGALIGNSKPGNLPRNTTSSQLFGSPRDSWGAALTPAIVNDPTFGVVFVGVSALTRNVTWEVFNGLQLNVFFNAYAAVDVSVTTDTIGSIAPTALTGYQMFAAIYDPVTQHMGNRLAIGTPFTVSATASAIVLTGIPSLASVDTEWVTALGITNDGGQVPYWLVDPQGNNIVVGNSATMATVLFYLVNTLQELPYRNDPPQPMDKFARVGTRIFGHLSGNPYLQYSNDAADVSNADYVGDPVQSWPPDQQEPLPTGELPTSIHAYRLEGWFFSRNNLCIWSQFLLQQGVNPWRGPWPGGCAGQRAFVETPHGPFWVSGEAQLCTFVEDGVVSVSDEYEASLLAQIARSTIGQTEVAYLRDPKGITDEIVIRGLDKNGNVVIVVHDFHLRDQRSEHGQGYNFTYTGLTVRTFAGAGFTPRQNVYDTSGHMRLWAGANEGFIAQLEDGSTSDNGTVYSGDYVALVNCGPNYPGLAEMEWQGDENIQMSWSSDYSQGLDGFITAETEKMPDGTSQWAGKMVGEARWLYLRLQLTAHPADGNFDLTDPPNCPMPTYGCMNVAIPKFGAQRKEAR